MMKIEQIEVTRLNAFDVMNGKDIYVISKGFFANEKVRMQPISETDVKNLISNDSLVVRITVNEGA